METQVTNVFFFFFLQIQKLQYSTDRVKTTTQALTLSREKISSQREVKGGTGTDRQTATAVELLIS